MEAKTNLHIFPKQTKSTTIISAIITFFLKSY